MAITALHLAFRPACIILPLALQGCASSVRPPPAKPCIPRCQKSSTCDDLDARLVLARKPLLACVDREARRGNLQATHRCYRSLRLLESARWWLKTLMNQDEQESVYKPSERFKQEFLCRIEQLAAATSAQHVERLYLDMIRSFP